jgi:hypothetical protein
MKDCTSNRHLASSAIPTLSFAKLEGTLPLHYFRQAWIRETA